MAIPVGGQGFGSSGSHQAKVTSGKSKILKPPSPGG
jgi:hypothetical protein